MRYEEDKIFGAYMDSLLVEKKKGLPPWLKGKGKKMVKENMNDENIVGSDENGDEDGCIITPARRQRTGIVADRRALDLDDISTHVAEHHGGVGTG